MRRILTAMVGLLLSASALAATGNLSFTRPTARADGSTLASSEIASYEISCTFTPTGGSAAACAGQAPTSFTGASTGGLVTFTTTTDGQACFTLRTVDTGGRRSDPSPVACKPVTVSPPNPPGSVVVAFNVTINGQSVQVTLIPAFGVTATGTRSGTVYGFVRAGSPCMGGVLFTYRGQSYRRVPREHVGWWRTTPNDNAAAPCAAT